MRLGLSKYLWKNIRRGWEKFCSHTGFEGRDGSDVRFWHDLWYVDTALKEAFLFLFGIVCAKDASIAALMEFSGGVI
jgi:hypothetical protein